MQKVKAIIKNTTGEHLPIEKMDIQFATTDYVLANYKGYGFSKVYAPFDGYTIILENN